MAESDRDRVAEALRFLNVVCLGMVFSVFAYAVVAWFVTSGSGTIEGPHLPSALAWVGAVVAAALLVAAPIVQRRAREGTAIEAADPGERRAAGLEAYRLGTLLAFLLRDGAAIVGLMLTIITGEPIWTYALGAVTVVAMFWGWPRREDLDELFARHGAVAT